MTEKRDEALAWIWTVVIGALSLGSATAIVWLLWKAMQSLRVW